MSSWKTPPRRAAWNARSVRGAGAGAGDPLLGVVDACLAGVIFVAPLVLGGRHDLGRLAFIVLAALGAGAWFSRQALRGETSPPRWPLRILLALAALVLVFQVIPLPASWIARLSPRTVELLPLWSGPREPGELGVWSTLSLAPQATRLALAMLVAYGLLFFTVLGRIRDESDVTRLVKWMALSAGLMACVGLLQFVASNGKFLWIYEHPSRDAGGRLSGPFANRNHFAHFLALGLPAAAAWLALTIRERDPSCATGSASATHRGTPDTGRASGTREGVQRSPRNSETFAAAGLLVLVAATALVTCSRGGVLALAVASGVVMLCLRRSGLIDNGRTWALAAAGFVVFCAVAVAGYDKVAERLSSLTSQSLDELDESASRRKIWQANVAAIRAGGWFGSGAGSHAEIYPAYMPDPPTRQYTHAESGYLQVLTENGPLGGALLIAALALSAGACFRALRAAHSPNAKACASAATAALAASAVHSLCDFVWYIPACLSLTLIFVACAMRLGELAENQSKRAPASAKVAARPSGRLRAATWAAAVALAGAFAAVEFIGPAAASLHWDAYLRMSSAHRDFVHQVLTLAPGDAAAALADARRAQQAALESMIQELSVVVRRYPACHAAHSALANRSLQLFNLEQEASDNPMPASQIFGAAVASQFRSSAELRAWLDRAVGPKSQWLDRALVHARAAVRLAPLEGEPYAVLAEVCFLAGEGLPEADAYLAQATRVRPYDGDLLFEIGVQWASRGALAPGLACWAQALRIKGPHRIQTARCIAGQFPIAEIIARHAPEWDTLPEYWRVVQASSPAETSAFLTYAEDQARREAPTLPPVQAARVWRTLAGMETEAAHADRALAILSHASQFYPEDYATRRMFGFALSAAGRMDEAAHQLQWCLGRRPDDAAVQRQLAQTSRQRLAAQPSEAVTK